MRSRSGSATVTVRRLPLGAGPIFVDPTTTVGAVPLTAGLIDPVPETAGGVPVAGVGVPVPAGTLPEAARVLVFDGVLVRAGARLTGGLLAASVLRSAGVPALVAPVPVLATAPMAPATTTATPDGTAMASIRRLDLSFICRPLVALRGGAPTRRQASAIDLRRVVHPPTQSRQLG
ncbi:MAG: hypothetical protein ACRDY2_12935 [Acidimicrobiales bacterium]